MAERLEGSESVTVLRKKGGDEHVAQNDQRGSGEFGEHESDDELIRVKVSSGRTVCMGRFAFARIECGVSVLVGQEDADEGYEVAGGVVAELLERELATLHSKKREKKEMRFELSGVRVRGVVVTLGYGLTIPTANYESSKVDIVREQAIGDLEEFEPRVTALQKWVETRISEEHEKVIAGRDQKASAPF